MNGEEVVASTGEPAFAVDESGSIVAWNQSAQRFFGYRPAEVIGRKGWQLLQGEDLFANPYCSEGCPLRNRILRGFAVNPAKLYFHDALGVKRLTRVSLLVVPGKKVGRKEVVHLIQPLVAEHEPEEARPTARAARPNHNTRLTPRELEVLSHLAEARGNSEIADVLCIGRSTVRNHIQSILTKLKVHSRLEAVVLARRIGLL